MNPPKHHDYTSSLRESTQQFLFLIEECYITGILKFGNSVLRDKGKHYIEGKRSIAILNSTEERHYSSGTSWLWSYVSWIYNYLCNQCLSSLMLWVLISTRARCTTLCDKVCHWLATDRWFSPGPPVSSTNNTDCNDITEILLKVALNTSKQTTLFIKISGIDKRFVRMVLSSYHWCIRCSLL